MASTFDIVHSGLSGKATSLKPADNPLAWFDSIIFEGEKVGLSPSESVAGAVNLVLLGTDENVGVVEVMVDGSGNAVAWFKDRVGDIVDVVALTAKAQQAVMLSALGGIAVGAVGYAYLSSR